MEDNAPAKSIQITTKQPSLSNSLAPTFELNCLLHLFRSSFIIFAPTIVYRVDLCNRVPEKAQRAFIKILQYLEGTFFRALLALHLDTQ